MSAHVLGLRRLPPPHAILRRVCISQSGADRFFRPGDGPVPFAGLSAVFSDAVMCRFRLRPVTIAATGPAAGFDIGDSEFTFDCTFEVPVQRDGGAAQEGRCTLPAGESVAFTVDDEKAAAARACVSSPDAVGSVLPGRDSDRETIQTGRLALKEAGTNGVYNSNILSIVLEFSAQRC